MSSVSEVINYTAPTDIETYLGVKLLVFDPPTDEEIMQTYLPDMWVETKRGKHINENVFARAFRDVNNLRYNNGLFYTRNGKRTEEILSREIWESIADEEIGITQNVAQIVTRLMNAVKLASTVPALKTDEDVIPFANGDFHLRGWEFHLGEFSPTAYRLPVPLMPSLRDTPYFMKWLRDLFYEDDIKLIQEYLGYCLVCTTKAQKALFLVGEGGAGKSGIGVILQALLGDAEINIANTQEFLQDKFRLAELEHKLVIYDDDLDSSALTDTGLYKKLITNTLNITADRKYGQPFKFRPEAKLVACCNQMLSSARDTTEGFYRRLLPVIIKPIAPDFRPDPRFYDHLAEEASGIAQWSLMGLCRLVENNWILSESDRTKAYLAQKRSIENPMGDFMASVFEFGDQFPGVTTADILRVYEVWCRRNRVTAWKDRTVQQWLSDNSEKYGIAPSSHITDGDRQVRGYKNLSIKMEWSERGKISLI